jgi:hypothetical protein
MLHLSSERLAALADSEPAPFESDHLAGCADCARERAAHRALLMMARADREHLGMPLTRWDSLAPELHRAGLVTAGALMSAPAVPDQPLSRRPPMRRMVAWAQAAAVLILLGGGAALGRLSAGASPFGSLDRTRDAAPDLPSVGGIPLPPLPPEAPGVAVALAPDVFPEFSSVDEARSALQRYEFAYQLAARYLADHDSTARVGDTDAFRTRLAALDRAGRAMSDALREVPYDPVINGYYLTTLGQREATLRQLDTSLPEGYRVRSF